MFTYSFFMYIYIHIYIFLLSYHSIAYHKIPYYALPCHTVWYRAMLSVISNVTYDIWLYLEHWEYCFLFFSIYFVLFYRYIKRETLNLFWLRTSIKPAFLGLSIQYNPLQTSKRLQCFTRPFFSNAGTGLTWQVSVLLDYDPRLHGSYAGDQEWENRKTELLTSQEIPKSSQALEKLQTPL